MIHSIRGKLKEKSPTQVVVEVGGVSFRIAVPVPTFDRLPEASKEVELLTYLNVREDSLDLYGFITEDELSLFKLLISVNKIGPKLAMGIISATTPDEFKRRIIADDVGALTTLPGIGPKTAKRIIVELKEKFVTTDMEKLLGSTETGSDEFNDALAVLTSLGFSRVDAYRVLTNMKKSGEFEGGVEKIVRVALTKA